MNVYSIKIALRGVSPMVWRRLRIAGDTSLAGLHYIIQITQGWADDYLHRFRIHGKDYGINKPGAVSYSDNARELTVSHFGLDTGDRFTYEYNYFANWFHDIRIEAIESRSPRTKTPFCLGGNGMPSVTESNGYRAKIDFLTYFAECHETATVGDLRDRIEALDAVCFNRKKVNRDLAQLDLESPYIDEILRFG